MFLPWMYGGVHRLLSTITRVAAAE